MNSFQFKKRLLVKSPDRVAVSKNQDILISSGEKEIIRYDSTFSSRSITFSLNSNNIQDYPQMPKGLTFQPHSENLLITNIQDSNIYCYSMNDSTTQNNIPLQYLYSIQKYDIHETAHFSNPLDISCKFNGDFFVSDADNNQIVVFDSRGSYIGTSGKMKGRYSTLRRNRGICFLPGSSENSSVIISDRGNRRLVVYDFNFGRNEYIMEVILDWKPHSVVSDQKGYVYVSFPEQHMICVYEPRMNFRKFNFVENSIGQNFFFNNPKGLCFNKSNDLIIANEKNDEILILEDL